MKMNKHVVSRLAQANFLDFLFEKINKIKTIFDNKTGIDIKVLLKPNKIK